MDYTEVARQLGKRGGEKTRERHGVEYFKRISKKAAEARKKTNGEKYGFKVTHRISGPGVTEWMRETLKRDRYMCVDCDSEEKLHIHHLDKSGKSSNPNNNLDNLITVCARCHQKRHGA
jgi:hypothetical protein